MQSNRYDIHQAKFSPEIVERLENVLKIYQEKANSNPNTLRQLIPAEEIWRYFVEVSVQKNGRNLKDSEFFKTSAQNNLFSLRPFNLTVKEYVENIEKIPFSERKEKSKLTQFLKSRQWNLSDEECQNITLGDLLTMDKAWLPFEQNEPNYFHALYLAFNQLFIAQNFDLSLQKKLHAVAVNKVKGTHYDGQETTAGEFRTNMDATFALNKANATENGFVEFLQRAEPGLSIALRIFDGNEMLGFVTISEETLPVIKKYAQEVKAREKNKYSYESPRFPLLSISVTDDQIEFVKRIKSDESIKHIFLHMGECVDMADLGRYLFRLMCEERENVRLNLYSDQNRVLDEHVLKDLNSAMQKYLDDFSDMLKFANTPIEKLYVIIAYIQECEQLHAFKDGNCRALPMLGTMFLCLQAGFPLPLLNDANRFDLSDRNSLVEEVISGFENTFGLIDSVSAQKPLFDVSTKEILEFLQSKHYLHDRLNYFLETVAIEEKNRPSINHRMQM